MEEARTCSWDRGSRDDLCQLLRLCCCARLVCRTRVCVNKYGSPRVHVAHALRLSIEICAQVSVCRTHRRTSSLPCLQFCVAESVAVNEDAEQHQSCANAVITWTDDKVLGIVNKDYGKCCSIVTELDLPAKEHLRMIHLVEYQANRSLASGNYGPKLERRRRVHTKRALTPREVLERLALHPGELAQADPDETWQVRRQASNWMATLYAYSTGLTVWHCRGVLKDHWHAASAEVKGNAVGS